MDFLNYSEGDFNNMAERLGTRVAGEILLLMIARQCKTTTDWRTARQLGIPWMQKSWTGLIDLQTKDNTAVLSTALEIVNEEGSAALSSSGLLSTR